MKKLEVEKLGEDKYRIKIISVEEVNKKHLKSIFEENRRIIKDCEQGKADVTEYLQGNEAIEAEVCGA